MHILDGCSAGGKYVYQRTTLATDTIEIQNQDELFSKLPLGAVSLEGELGRSGRLAVRTTVSGHLKWKEGSPLPPGEACSRATHVIAGVAIGAFKLLSGGTARAGGGVGVGGIGEVGGKASRSEEVLREAGDPSACSGSTDESAPANCRSPIQVFLHPVEKQAPKDQAGAAPSTRVSENAPPTADSVRVNFTAYSAADRWRLFDGNAAPLCDLPCSRWVPRDSSYFLQLDGPTDVKKVRLPKLAYSPGREVDAAVQPGRGSKALGIVATSVGGATLFGGLVAMLIVGVEGGNLLAPSLVAGGGAAVLTGGIVLTIYSKKDGWIEWKVSPGDTGSTLRDHGIVFGDLQGPRHNVAQRGLESLIR
jgi:hypothetical protein